MPRADGVGAFSCGPRTANRRLAAMKNHRHPCKHLDFFRPGSPSHSSLPITLRCESRSTWDLPPCYQSSVRGRIGQDLFPRFGNCAVSSDCRTRPSHSIVLGNRDQPNVELSSRTDLQSVLSPDGWRVPSRGQGRSLWRYSLSGTHAGRNAAGRSRSSHGGEVTRSDSGSLSVTLGTSVSPPKCTKRVTGGNR